MPCSSFVNIDIYEAPGVDLTWDLESLPWPWPDNSVSELHVWPALFQYCRKRTARMACSVPILSQFPLAAPARMSSLAIAAARLLLDLSRNHASVCR
jgi:hypothetical protein